MVDVADRYTGEGGRAYHVRREGARSTAGQASRAAYFESATRSTDVVLDFGCATGGMVTNLPAARRIGVEICEHAADEARQRLDVVYATTQSIDDASVDAVVSFHAMEHVSEPHWQLREFLRVLRPEGRLTIAIPYEDAIIKKWQRSWKPSDADMHLYSWTPLTLGNLLSISGFAVDKTGIRPWSEGGRLAEFFGPLGLKTHAQWLKAMRWRRFHVLASAHKPASSN